MPETLAQLVRKKYPGAYDDLSDGDLEAKVDAKYPGAYADLPRSRAGWSGQNYVDAAKGLAGGPKSVYNAFAGATRVLAPVAEKIGLGKQFPPLRQAPIEPGEEAAATVGNVAQFFAPGLGPAKGVGMARAMLHSGAGAAGLTAAQQGEVGPAAAVAGAFGAAGPLAMKGVGAAGEWIGAQAEPLVRAAIKPTVSAMQRVAGAAREGISAKAQSLVRFIIENRVTTADKARAIFQEAEYDLQRLLSVKNAPTDAPTRALRYLDALERSAAKQALPAQDVAIIRNAADEIMNTGLGENVTVAVPAVTRQAPKVKNADIETFLEAKRPILSSKGKPDDGVPLLDEAGRRVGTRGGLSWKEYAGIDLPALKNITSRQAAKAIEKDADNPTYVRIKDAVRADWEDQLASEGADTTVQEVVKPATEKTMRYLRENVPAAEALERARANARWDTRKAWGEQKGAQQEASKTVERALRDAVKTAVPEAKPLLRKEGLAIQAEKALDRSEFRAANRDAVSLPAHVIAAGEIARGKVPFLAFAANWLRNNQLKAGIYADKLAKAIERGHAPEVAFYLAKVGASVPAQTMGGNAK